MFKKLVGLLERHPIALKNVGLTILHFVMLIFLMVVLYIVGAAVAIHLLKGALLTVFTFEEAAEIVLICIATGAICMQLVYLCDSVIVHFSKKIYKKYQDKKNNL